MKSKNQNKKAFKRKKSSKNIVLFQSKVYFLTYKGISNSGIKITKSDLVEFLINNNPYDRTNKPEKYLICEQTYESGQPHFHVILVYSKRKKVLHADYYDYLDIHPNIQTMRNMKAALEYVCKEDLHPLTNMDLVQQRRVTKAKDSSSLYQFLQEQMKKDPFNFDVDDYCVKYNLGKQIYKANYTKAIVLLKRLQPAYARKLLKQNKLGLKFITPDLISKKLTKEELIQFYSHSCYQKIIDHINQIHKYPNLGPSTQAPLKTKHLLIVGDSDIGKTSLICHKANEISPYPGLAYYYSTYYLSVGQKYFPPYRSFDYSLVNWQQFTIDSDMFPKKGYNRLLNYLDGSVSALPQKGRPPVERQDNPKHILTSNRTLQDHICKTFKSDDSRSLAFKNLPARIDSVIIPKGKNIHFLRKLFIANDVL